MIPQCVKQVHPEQDVTIEELMEYDFYAFFCYLATYDAEVSDAEIEFISSCYPKPQTRKDIVQATVENQWIGEKYLSTHTACLPLFVEADNFLYENKSTRAGNLTKAWDESVESLGKALSVCEGKVNVQTEKALSNFLVACRNYIDENAKWL